MLYRQKIYIALFRPVKLMSLWTDKRFLRARQRRVAKGQLKDMTAPGVNQKAKCTAIRRGYKRLGDASRSDGQNLPAARQALRFQTQNVPHNFAENGAETAPP